MRKIKIYLTGFVLFVSLPIWAGYQTNSLADELVQAQGSIQVQLENTLNAAARQIKQYGYTDQEANEMFKILTDRFPEDDLKTAIINYYGHNFSEAELKELLAVYQKPVMQKMIQKMPDLQFALDDVMKQYSQKIQVAIISMLSEKNERKS